MTRQCMYCRREINADGSPGAELVLDRESVVSHGICEPCFDEKYPDDPPADILSDEVQS